MTLGELENFDVNLEIESTNYFTLEMKIEIFQFTSSFKVFFLHF